MRKALTGLIAVGLALAMAACGSAGTASVRDGSGLKANMGALVGLAMPTKQQTRWIADGTNMSQQFHDMGYKTVVQFANDDAKKQIAQIQSMISAGAKLLVIAPVDGSSLNQVLATATRKHIPVLAYDRLIVGTPNVSGYTTFDNVRVGEQQGQLLARRLGLPDAKGPFTIELVAGAPTDNNSKIFFKGAMSVLKPYIDSGKLVVRSGQTSFAKASTANWDGVVAAKRMRLLLNEYYGATRLAAVLSPNDGIATEIIKEFLKAGYGTRAKPMPLISGQDAELNSVKAIIAGRQAGTVYKDTRELAKVAVQMGNALVTGAKPITNDVTSYNNGVKIVPTYLLPPVSVDKSNYESVLVGGGYYSQADLS